MNSMKDLEGDMSENLSHEIIGIDNGSIGIEEAFLAENSSPREPHSRAQNSTGEHTGAREVSSSINGDSSNTTGEVRGMSKGESSDKSTNTSFSDTQASGQTRAFRFVNNSPNSMYKPKSRMKPTFRVETQPTQNDGRFQNDRESVIIEQKFDNSGSDLQTNDRKYVFQLNVKRPPGRPRKYPVEKPKAKRPQGRPRKYPIEVTGTTINKSKVSKKTAKDITHTLPIDTELIGSSRKGRGRPKRGDKDLDVLEADGAYGHERSFAIATVNQSAASSNSHNPDKTS